jgi:hypothetical protein
MSSDRLQVARNGDKDRDDEKVGKGHDGSTTSNRDNVDGGRVDVNNTYELNVADEAERARVEVTVPERTLAGMYMAGKTVHAFIHFQW